MPVTSAADRWASKIVIVVQLVIWNAIGIVIIQSGVSTLQRRTLETTSHRTETNTTVNLDVESTISTGRTENEHDLIVVSTGRRDKNAKDEPPTQSPLDYSGASVTDQRVLITRTNNHLAEGERLVDYPESKRILDKILRIGRDKEREPQISNSVHTNSILKPVLKEGNETDAKGKNLNFVETAMSNGPRFVGLERAKEVSLDSVDSQIADIIWRNKNKEKLYYVRANDVTMGVGLVVIGSIMLLIGLAVIIIRILDERRWAKGAYALSREDPPPTYAEAVCLSEAPRYSTLALNE